MGVRYLESYLEKNSSACNPVSIPDIVRKHRKETGEDPVIVLDALSCLRIVCESLNWLTGGQFKEGLDRIDRFIESFTSLGCRLVVFFDGPLADEKVPTWKKRRLASAAELSQLFLCLEEGYTTQQIERDYTRVGAFPKGLKIVFFYALSRNENCTVITAIRECDEEVSQYAAKNKCLAILAQDTDYVIYRAVPYYLSMKRLDLQTMTTYCYSGDMLARELGFPVEQLPLFASLVSNDMVPYDLLKDFHSKLKKILNDWNIIRVVGMFVSRLHNVDLTSVASQVFGQASKSQLLQNSIASYDLSTPPPSNEKNIPDKNWQKITELAKKKCIEGYYNAPIYDIVVLSKFNTGTSLETYDPTRVIQPVGTVLKELRRAIYGILLKEKPLDEGSEDHYVKELVMTGYDSLEDYDQVKPKYLEEVEHPGLIALWTCGDEMQETRWKMLAEVFTTEADKLNQLPPYFLVPALATRYFKMQYEELKEWEVDALISCNVCVRHYESRKLADLPADPLTYRQIWIYSVVTKLYHTISQLLFYIGEPIPFQYVVPHQYTDGKLFHEKYRQASQSCPQEKLLEHQVENKQYFNQIKSIALE